MSIDDLNTLPPEEAAAVLRACADVDSWVLALVDGRPFTGREALLDQAVHAAARWTDDEVDRALRDHPRIGEQPAEGGGAAAEHSRREQSGVEADADQAARLADGNRRYEERFGRIYLVRAAGRSGAELLDLLEQRLANDPATEREETKRQLAEIAVLRLRALVDEDAP